jgi:ABC-2 type transport system permease protein
VLVAPVTRTSIVLGQSLGSTTLALLQGVLFLLLAPLAGVPVSLPALLLAVVVLFCIAFGMTNLGLIIAWRMRSTQGFHAIMNLLLMPLWLLSGAFFPVTGVPLWLAWVMCCNPLTYGMAALRRSLYLAHPIAAGAVPALAPALGITVLFGVATLLAAVYTARQQAL